MKKEILSLNIDISCSDRDAENLPGVQEMVTWYYDKINEVMPEWRKQYTAHLLAKISGDSKR